MSLDDTNTAGQTRADLRWHKTACNLCYINCGVEVGVAGEGAQARIVRVRGDKASPKSHGYLCNKAQGIPGYVHHRDRLTTPLRKRADGTHEAINWDTAIADISHRLGRIRDVHGGRSLALYGGGGQGNHAGGAYANALMRGLGSRNVFNALSQEKTGDFWVNGHLFGSQTCHTAEDVEHCDLLLVIGANPWLAHGFPNARDHLNAIRKDPNRSLVVIDPRRTETAEVADLHLAVRPGTDAFLMGALLALLMQRGGFNDAFIAQRTTGIDAVRQALATVPVEHWAQRSDVPLAQLEDLAARIMRARSMVIRVELGLQQGVHSTLNSYLEKLLFLTTGHFGRPGTNTLHSWLQPLWGNARGQRFEPTGTEVIAGLLPPNVFPDAILSAHPDRLRAVWVDSSNPVNTAADTERVIEALRALELLVVVDVAYTETAALADYVLPASSQYEKCEYTLFNFEAPTNYFHVRAPVLEPLTGTLPEPQIYQRLAHAMGLMPPADAMHRLSEAARDGIDAFAHAFAEVAPQYPEAGPVMPLVLYATLGSSLPDGTAAAAPLWGAAQRVAKTQSEAVRRALGADEHLPPGALGHALFQKLVAARSGMAFSTHTDPWSLIEHGDGRIRLDVPVLLESLASLEQQHPVPDPQWPFVLSAGQRRLQNANQIFRDPAFRRSDPDGALQIHPDDLSALGAAEGDWLAVESVRGRLVVRSKHDQGLRRGYVVLPHGYGQAYPNAQGVRVTAGPQINRLTDSAWRDPIAGTPYHKHVPVRIMQASAPEAAQAEAQSRQIRQTATV